MAYEHQMVTHCSILEVDQAGGAPVELVHSLRCSYPFPYIYRQTRAETAYDFQAIQILTDIPKKAIKENMRLIFSSGEDYRIHSVNKWPMVKPLFLEIVLQGDGSA